MEEKLHDLADQLYQIDLNIFVEDLILEKIVKHIHQLVVPSFWCNFSEKKDPIEGFECFHNAVYELNKHYETILPVANQLQVMRKCLNTSRILYGEDNVESVLKLLLRSALHSKIVPPNDLQMIEQFYKVSFKAFYNMDKAFKGRSNKF